MFDQAYQFVLEQIGKNDLIAGGAVLGVLAYTLNALRTVPFTLMRWGRLLFVTHIDIPDRSDSFAWVREWLAHHAYSKRARRITLDTKNKKAVVTPAPGVHLVWWNRTPVLITRIRKESTGDNASRAYREGWSITMIGRRKLVDKFIEECRLCASKEKDQFITVREADGHGYWTNGTKRLRRPISSVILPKDMSELLVDDLNKFIDSKDWYNKMSVPWRRGYLLEGQPGNGKSSIITAVASEIEFEIHVLNLKVANEKDLISLMSEVGEKSIILLEDIDCAFDKREDKEGISLSSLLNCLDGVNATEGRILFMTTNHMDKLDPALIRPGRIDLSLNLPNATEYQVKMLYERFYPESEDADDFATIVGPMDISMAKLQGHLLRFRGSCEDAKDNIGDMIDA